MIIGIDLGTTNSCAAVYKDGKAQIIPNSLGNPLTPSAISIDDNGNLLVGLAARERFATHPDQTVTNFKRYMGTKREIKLGKKSYSAEELSAMILSSIKRDAENFLGQEVTEAVITVPAYFNDKQRKATKRAGEIAGFKVERLINEPTAAALAYGIHTIEKDAQFLVFDLGGGTFDVSIVEIFDGIIEVRASTGNNYLGGEDFNDVIINHVKANFIDILGEKALQDEALNRNIRDAAEKARRQISKGEGAKISIIYNNEKHSIELTSSDFEEMCAPLIEKLREPVIRAVKDSDISVQELDEIILIGGATRMPVVRRAITKMFSRFPNYLINPDEAVALGAAVQAGLKARDIELKEIVITDVCPYTLGIDTVEQDFGGNSINGLFAPVIERNSVVPTSREKLFYNAADMQRSVEIKIYQGESRFVKDNIFLGKIKIDIPPKPRGEVIIKCRFTYDIDGLIEIDVDVPETGISRNLLIIDDDGPQGKELEKRREALKALKIHPRDNEQNIAIISRANRCYENSLGDERAMVGFAIDRFQLALNSQEPKNINDAKEYLENVLNAIDGETFF